MYEGKHIHFSPVDNRPLCSYSGKLCRQRRVNGYAFCIRHILEDKTAPFKQCAHVAKYNNQKCTNPIPAPEDREFCNSHMQVAGMAPKKERKNKKEKDFSNVLDGKLKFAERVKVLLKTEEEMTPDHLDCVDDPYAFSDATPDFVETSPHHRASTVTTCNNVTAVVSRLAAAAAAESSHDGFSEQLSTTRLECPKSNCVSDKTKGITCGSNPIRSSKTVNRLEAKIARNRILDKLKKNRPTSVVGNICTKLDFGGTLSGSTDDNSGAGVELDGSPAVMSTNQQPAMSESSSCRNPTPMFSSVIVNTSNCGHSGKTSTCSSSSSPIDLVRDQSTTYLNTEDCNKECNSLVRNSRTMPVYPNKLKKTWIWKKPELVTNAVHTFQRICENRGNFRTNLFPLGFDGTDSESEDSDTEIYQRHWFARPLDDDEAWVDEKNGLLLRPMKLELEKAELRRKCVQLRQAQDASLPTRLAECTLAQALVKASRSQSSRTARLIDAFRTKRCSQHKKKLLKNDAPINQKCCYSNEVSNCSQTALPYTRHCIKHIMYNVDQLLFEHCTAKFADNTQCCVPVFDICHELPLCVEHARKRDNYSKMSAEPKPKKPRKKTKPSALTRPPKRGKKKKRQSNSRVTDIATLSQSSTSQELPPTLHFDMSTSAMVPDARELEANDVADELVDGHMGPLESDLGNELDGPLSPGTIDKSLVGLPMDAAELANQATRLLEEHDFTDVLNKIPVDAFRELFSESKNGDMSPSKEEAEELERALAAVDKDVKSLEKYSSGHLDIHDSLLQHDNLSATIESTLSDLTGGSGIGMDSLQVITSSLTSSDLNSLTQVLSSMTSEGSLVNLPILSDIVTGPTNHHVNDGFTSVGGVATAHLSVCGGTRTDTTSAVTAADHFICDSTDVIVSSAAAPSHHGFWLSDHSTAAMTLGHNGLISPHTTLPSPFGHPSSSKCFPHSLTNRNRHHLNSLNSSLLENQLNLGPVVAPLVMELTENSTESVS